MRATVVTLCVEGIWQIIDDRLSIAINVGHLVISRAKFERCVPSDMMINTTSISPTLSVV